MRDSSQIIELLEKASAGDKGAEAELLPHVYSDLRAMAAKYLHRERPGHSLQATALVHEAYLRLIGGRKPVEWRGRTHFFATSARLMRRILTDHARHTKAAKRGGCTVKLELDDARVIGGSDSELLDN